MMGRGFLPENGRFPAFSGRKQGIEWEIRFPVFSPEPENCPERKRDFRQFWASADIPEFRQFFHFV